MGDLTKPANLLEKIWVLCEVARHIKPVYGGALWGHNKHLAFNLRYEDVSLEISLVNGGFGVLMYKDESLYPIYSNQVAKSLSELFEVIDNTIGYGLTASQYSVICKEVSNYSDALKMALVPSPYSLDDVSMEVVDTYLNNFTIKDRFTINHVLIGNKIKNSYKRK